MEREERRRADALDRYWDIFQRGEAQPGANGVDEVAAAVIQHLSRPRAENPAPAAYDRIRQRITARAKHWEGPWQTGSLPGAVPTTPAIPSPLHSPRPSSARDLKSIAAQFITVLLVLATLGFGILTLRSNQPASVPSTMAPALIATPATPTPGAVDGGTVVEISLPSGALINDVVGGLNHYTMESGMEGRWDWTCCVGARLDYILSGSLRVRSEGQMQVLRGRQSGTWEEIPAGTEVSLETGDSLYSRMEDAFDVINDGETPVELLDGVLFQGTAADDPVPHERSGRRVWGYHDQDISLMPTPLPPGPITLRLGQSTLAAGETLPPPSGAVMQLAVSLDEENLASTQHPGFEVLNLGEEPVDLYFLTLEPDAAGLETPAPSIP